MKLPIYIPSYNRAWTATTPDLLDEVGANYVLILRDQEQVRLYFENPKFRARRNKIVVLGGGSINEAREAARGELDYGDWCLQMDDNIRGFTAAEPDFYRREHQLIWKDGYRKNARGLYAHVLNIPVTFAQFYEQVITDSITEAENRGSNVVAFSALENPLFRVTKWNDVAYTQNKCVLLRKTPLLWDQSNGHPAMEEYALLAAQLLEYGRVLVNKWAQPVARHYEPGGLGPYQQRLPAKRAACADIIERYPGLFRPQRDGDLLLRWRTTEQIERWRAEMKASGRNPNLRDFRETIPRFGGNRMERAATTRSSVSTHIPLRDLFYSPAGATPQTPGRYCQLTGIPEVQDLRVGMDFRRPEFRREVFLRFYEFQLQHRAHPGCVYFVMPYLYKTFKWDREARLWFAFLNGNTQNPVTSFLIFKRFPDFAQLKIADLEKWFNQEFKRLAFDTDRRHQKSDFIDSVRCYQTLAHGGQEEFFSPVINTDDQQENFRKVWQVVRKQFYSFGRVASFTYLEFLRIMGVNLDCDQLFLEDINGSKSHRNGLAKVMGRDDLDWHESNPTGFDGNYTPEMLEWLNSEAALLLEEAKQRVAGKSYVDDVTYFTFESTLCTYKGWHRPNRRYPGVYLDMFHDRIEKAEAAWPEEDLGLFWDARKTHLPAHLRLEDNPAHVGVTPEKQNHYRKTGQVINMDEFDPVFQNDYNDRRRSAPIL